MTVSDPDDAQAAITVSCSVPSGTLFPIGTTTVTCTATDPAGNHSSGSFTVTVRGAGEQLADLAAAVRGVGPGTSLRDKVNDAHATLARHDVPSTCSILSAFVNEVKAQSGKKIPTNQAATLISRRQPDQDRPRLHDVTTPDR